MPLKKLFGKLHLWLGLASGLIIFIVCITAAIWAFSPEIEGWSQPYRHVAVLHKNFLPATMLKAIAEKKFTGHKANRISFEGKDKAATVDFYGADYYTSIFINPYTGEVLKNKNNRRDFFTIIITMHYTLLLGDVGGQVVRWATVIFLLMLISGIVLWWPKNKAAARQRFKVKWGTSPKRLNYDLHNVLGFYASWFILFAVFTGLVWTFTSVANAEYWISTGGKKLPDYPNPISIKKNTDTVLMNSIDAVFAEKLQQHSGAYGAALSFPADSAGAYTVSIYPTKQYYNYDNFYYNQYTLQQIPVAAFGKYANANTGEKLSRMNYDIHIGQIAGVPGRITMFLAALAGASLPVTGFYIWWGRKRRFKKELNNNG